MPTIQALYGATAVQTRTFENWVKRAANNFLNCRTDRIDNQRLASGSSQIWLQQIFGDFFLWLLLSGIFFGLIASNIFRTPCHVKTGTALQTEAIDSHCFLGDIYETASKVNLLSQSVNRSASGLLPGCNPSTCWHFPPLLSARPQNTIAASLSRGRIDGKPWELQWMCLEVSFVAIPSTWQWSPSSPLQGQLHSATRLRWMLLRKCPDASKPFALLASCSVELRKVTKKKCSF